MVWNCEACTFRNINDGSKSCITCGTRRSKVKEATVDLTAGNDNADDAAEKTSGKKRPASTGGQRTLFGGVVADSKSETRSGTTSKASKKVKLSYITTEAVFEQHNKKPGPIPQPRCPAPTARQSTMVENTMAGYRPISKDSYRTLKKRSADVLTEVFGIEKLRNQQPKAVECFLQGRSSIVVMATGGGKSLCYQLPAVAKGGTTIVISPLIALMRDQIEALKKKGVAAECINSSNKEKENVKVMERMIGRSMDTSKKSKKEEIALLPITLVYCTPELLQTQRFQNILKELYDTNRLSGVAIDEAHCMSSWGHDFRPAYRRLDVIPEMFPRIPCMALTATATPAVIDDLKKALHLENAPCHVGSFDRPNIFYKVHYKDYLDEVERQGSLNDLANFITKQHKRAQKNSEPIAGIVYCHKRADTELLAKEIAKRTGVAVAAYNAGLKDAERTRVQMDWTTGKLSVICATVSFGMGIDLDCVRYVIHWTIPKNMAGFYQESGRAGRDGKASISLVYYSKDDANLFAYLIRTQESRKSGNGNDTSAKRDQEALQQVIDYCTNTHCRRQYVLKHFGEKETDPKAVCQKACDYCCNPQKVERTIRSSVAARAMSFQRKQSTKSNTAFDGQWGKPHGDDEFFDAEDDYTVGGLRITSSSNGDNDAPVVIEGFKTAKSMVDWDELEKEEARGVVNLSNSGSGGFFRFKGSGNSTTNRDKRDIYPEHIRKEMNLRTESLMKVKVKPKPKETSSKEHAANAASLQAQLEAIQKQKEALLAKKRSATASTPGGAPPLSAPPAYVSSKIKHTSRKR